MGRPDLECGVLDMLIHDNLQVGAADANINHQRWSRLVSLFQASRYLLVPLERLKDLPIKNEAIPASPFSTHDALELNVQ